MSASYTAIMPPVRPRVQKKKRQMAAKKRTAKKPLTRAAGKKQAITAMMPVSHIVELYPQTREVLSEYGLHCFGCAFNAIETLAEGCAAHGFDEQDVANLVEDLNDIVALAPPRPQSLTITESAARAILAIMEREGKTDHSLIVTSDGNGGFCMELSKKPHGTAFRHPQVPHVVMYASDETLTRIGGSTIDFREERFKLDLR